MRFNPFKNILLRVSAVALALLLWVHVATNKTYEYRLDIPIRIVDLPEKLVLVSDTPENVYVKVKATGKQLISMAMTEPEIRISAAKFKRGLNKREIKDSDILGALTRPHEEFELILPQELRLRCERRLEKRVPVRADNLVEPATGFAIMSRLRIEPESVTVSGPASVVSRLRSLRTDSTKFVELRAPVTEEIDLIIADSLRLMVSDSAVLVTIEVEVKRQKIFSEVAVIPPRNFKSKRFSYLPDTLSLTLEIPQSQVDSFTVNDFRVTFKSPPILKDSARAEIRYDLPENVGIVGPKPDSLLILAKR
ncbi:MAG: hypothetical protein KAT58_01085 [candidate division Zixibacteria bacterium]|nr:hypothetical protein [candidate division Zixibacteria bacterium]